jgi:hypothetical protein
MWRTRFSRLPRRSLDARVQPDLQIRHHVVPIGFIEHFMPPAGINLAADIQQTGIPITNFQLAQRQPTQTDRIAAARQQIHRTRRGKLLRALASPLPAP